MCATVPNRAPVEISLYYFASVNAHQPDLSSIYLRSNAIHFKFIYSSSLKSMYKLGTLLLKTGVKSTTYIFIT